jgi:transposase
VSDWFALCGMDETQQAPQEPVKANSTRTSASTSAPSPQRIELITRTERRRHWSAEQKRAIVAESYAPEASALGTARKYAISSGQLYLWRSQMRHGELEAANATSHFLRLDTPATTQQHCCGLIEIALPHGVVLRVDAAVDPAALRRVLEALSGR